MPSHNLLIAFALTSLAGLATGIGGALAFVSKHTNKKLLALGLGFSAGVMIYLSFIEIFPEAEILLVEHYGENKGRIITLLAFFGGIALSVLLDHFLPEGENLHEFHPVEDITCRRRRHGERKKCQKMMRTGIFVTIAIVLHNIPEGMLTFTASMQDPRLGLSLAMAIMLHNIPEGIAVAIPVYYATCDKLKAFTYSLLSGLAEPLGALLAYLILLPFLNDVVFGIMLAATGGIMVYLALDELLPSSQQCGEHRSSLAGLLGGMFVISLNLLMF